MLRILPASAVLEDPFPPAVPEHYNVIFARSKLAPESQNMGGTPDFPVHKRLRARTDGWTELPTMTMQASGMLSRNHQPPLGPAPHCAFSAQPPLAHACIFANESKSQSYTDLLSRWAQKHVKEGVSAD